MSIILIHQAYLHKSYWNFQCGDRSEIKHDKERYLTTNTQQCRATTNQKAAGNAKKSKLLILYELEISVSQQTATVEFVYLLILTKLLF